MSAAFPCGPGEHPVAALNFARHKYQGDTPPPEHEDLVSVYMSGQESEKWLDKSDEALGAGIWRAAQDSFPFLRGEAEMILHKRRRRAIPVHEVGRFKLASAFWAEQKPPLAFAGDYLSTATVEGALASGVRAATRLVSEATSWTNPARC
jgi:predicted NAD/FAD-dependent oxidoreductase